MSGFCILNAMNYHLNKMLDLQEVHRKFTHLLNEPRRVKPSSLTVSHIDICFTISCQDVRNDIIRNSEIVSAMTMFIKMYMQQ